MKNFLIFHSLQLRVMQENLVLGKIENVSVVCMYGRSHIYEGHDPKTLAKPIRVLKDIGCKLLIVTNAAGSLDQGYAHRKFNGNNRSYKLEWI